MKISLSFLFSAAAIVAVSVAFANDDEKKPGASSFALVELFTSEGCSSCPSADNLTAKIQREFNGKPVYFLAYHVDYWDRLGWKDSFSSAAWSQRQRQYASWMHKEGVYTPQIVVNGRTEFVGSDERRFRKAIQQSFTAPAPELSISLDQLTAKEAFIHAKYPVVSGRIFYVACVQKKAIVQVTRGENSGETLSHINIVRSLQQVDYNNQRVSVKLPSGFDKSSWEIIGFIQDNHNGAIISAAPVLLM